MNAKELADLLANLPEGDNQLKVAIAYDGNVREFVQSVNVFPVRDWEDETKTRSVVVLSSKAENDLKDRWDSAL